MDDTRPLTDPTEVEEAIDQAWTEIDREIPIRDQSYWDAGVTSLEVALFAERLGDRMGTDVGFADILENPSTQALAQVLSARATQVPEAGS